MKLHGLDVSMYMTEKVKSEEAWGMFLKVADEYIAENRMMHPWIKEKLEDPKYADRISNVDPARASKFYYIHDEGVSAGAEVLCMHILEIWFLILAEDLLSHLCLCMHALLICCYSFFAILNQM